jgi:glucose-6-phosphate 1-dehydrogenase
VVIEKPFGRDLASAQALNWVAHGVFYEGQIYRIDHYLGKETVQNLMVFRFANAIFEPLWNRNYVDSIQITVAEEVSAGDRAGYYDHAGVVRDMVQNHLLQLLTLVAMEPPNVPDAESLRNKKVEVLKAIRRWNAEDAPNHAIRGQYRGYLDEKDVSTDSNTAIYAAIRLYIDNWRWRGVPFYIRTGKDMAEKTSEVVIQFQRPPHTMFTLARGQEISSNALALCLQPDEGIHLKFQVKVPDQETGMRSMDMEFHYESAFKSQSIPETYERLL